MEHAAGVKPSALRSGEPSREARAMLGAKKKRRKKKPVHERLWFLLAGLALLIGAATWAFWPPGEEALFAKAEALMASNDRFEWDTARHRYLEPLLERFPDGAHAAQAQAYIDQIEMEKALKRLEIDARFDRPPKTAGGRAFVAARAYEEFGDLFTAQAKYRALVERFAKETTERPFVLLAQRRLKGMTARPEGVAPTQEVLRRELDRADSLLSRGRGDQANAIWLEVTRLYALESGQRADAEAVAPLVELARKRIAGEKPSRLSSPAGAGVPLQTSR